MTHHTDRHVSFLGSFPSFWLQMRRIQEVGQLFNRGRSEVERVVVAAGMGPGGR